jgi:hypothetical protein
VRSSSGTAAFSYFASSTHIALQRIDQDLIFLV